jgi:hypothetical protein
MAENKKGFVLYADLITVVKKLVEQDRKDKTNNAGELFLTILEYVNDLNPKPVNFITELSFEPIKSQLKRDLVKFEAVKKFRSENGKKGAEIKKQNQANDSKPKLNQAKLSNTKNTQAKQADIDNDNVNVIDNDIVIDKKEKELKLPFDSKEFLESWSDLLTQPKWKKKTRLALTASLKKLEGQTETIAIQMIQDCIAGGWQGLFAPKKEYLQQNKISTMLNNYEIAKGL